MHPLNNRVSQFPTVVKGYFSNFGEYQVTMTRTFINRILYCKGDKTHHLWMTTGWTCRSAHIIPNSGQTSLCTERVKKSEKKIRFIPHKMIRGNVYLSGEWLFRNRPSRRKGAAARWVIPNSWMERRRVLSRLSRGARERARWRFFRAAGKSRFIRCA